MRNGTPHIAALARTLDMLDAVVTDGGEHSIAAIARELAIPVATAHRQVATLVAQRYLTRLEGGHHIAGPRLLGLFHRIDEKRMVTLAAAPVLNRLARKLRCVVQLGTFENDMVTYRIKAGRGAGDLFTRTGMQLEAYCSGMGKVLLANLPEAEREAYLATGPFVALTAQTITDPGALRAELAHVRTADHAIDRGEIAEGLRCVAVPVHAPDGRVIAAASVSRQADEADDASILAALREAAREIEQAAFPGLGVNQA